MGKLGDASELDEEMLAASLALTLDGVYNDQDGQYEAPLRFPPAQFKTRMCAYPGGSCPHGARCLFAHSVDELRRSPSSEYKTKLCRYSMAACPFAAAGRCQFAHSADELRVSGPSARRFKTRLCKYHLAGHCPYAATNTCQFAHSEEELRAPPAFRPSPLEWGSPSSYDPMSPPGKANNQENVSSVANVTAGVQLRATLEEKRFTKLCKYYLAGHCPFDQEGKCQYAHSAAELRRRSPPPPRQQPERRSPTRRTCPKAPPLHFPMPGGLGPRIEPHPPQPPLHFAQPSLVDPWRAYDVGQPDWSFRGDVLH